MIGRHLQKTSVFNTISDLTVVSLNFSTNCVKTNAKQSIMMIALADCQKIALRFVKV